MGMFDNVFKKEEKKHTLGVCIPDKSREKKVIAEEEHVEGRGFLVSGVFHVHDSFMAQGKAVHGPIRKNHKLSLLGTTLTIKEIQVERKETEILEEGQKGALFLTTDDGKAPIIKAGDLLEL